GGRIAFEATYVALGAAYVALLLAGALAARKRWPGVAVGIALFAITVLPTSNVVTTDLMMMLSERFLYVPLLGIVLATATAGVAVAQTSEAARGTLVVATCAATVALGALASRRAADFQDEEWFWARELALHPDSLEALRFHIRRRMEQKRFGKALE